MARIDVRRATVGPITRNDLLLPAFCPSLCIIAAAKTGSLSIYVDLAASLDLGVCQYDR